VSRNKNRTGDNRPDAAEAPAVNSLLNFVKPSEFVDLPSGGSGYPEGHILYGEDTVEIYHMTAKDEDILTSQTLLKKGIAIDRFLENVIVDKTLKPESLLIGDKNAILIAARISGYGSDYDASVICSECDTRNKLIFNLHNSTIKKAKAPEELDVILFDNGTYSVKLPFSGFTAVVRLMTGGDETFLSKYMFNKKNKELPDNILTTQFKRIISSVDGYTDREVLNHFIENMPTADARRIRVVNKLITSDIQIRQTLVCKNCSHEEEVDVPFGANFFWPDR